MVDWFGTVTSVTDSIWLVVQIMLVLGIVGGILFLIFFILPYKHHFRVRELTGDKTRVYDDKAKEINEQGVPKWKLLKRKHKVPIPPASAIHLTKKGKFSVEAYYTPEGEYKYVKDKGISDEVAENFTPLTTKDREFYANEMRKAEEYKKKSGWDYIKELTPLIALMLIFILMLVFWQEIAKPGIEITNTAAGIAEDQKETTKMLRDIIQNRQTITNEPKPDDTGET